MEWFQFFHIRGVCIYVKMLDPFFVGWVFVQHMGAHFAVFFVAAFLAVPDDQEWFCRPFLDEDIVIETVVSVKDRHKAHDFRAVRHMVRRVAGAVYAFHHAVCAGAHGGEGAAD